jgi:hypothetical protein
LRLTANAACSSPLAILIAFIRSPGSGAMRLAIMYGFCKDVHSTLSTIDN